VRSLLSNYADFEVVGEADSGSSALERVKGLAPDVILLDIRMPGETGVEVVGRLRQTVPEAKILMLSSFDDDDYVTGALRAGAHGYVLKNVSDEMLARAIRDVHYGERVLGPQVMDRMIEYYVDEAHEATAVGLTEEDRRILRLLSDGASNAEIAASLYLSETTVKRKLQDIFDTLGVHSRAQAAAEAVRRRLI
jgi:DNA-binding NarL/FixJ family response regulator